MEPKAWECPRCHRMNAPHVDRCDCDGKSEVTAAPAQPLVIYIYEGTPLRITWPTPLPDTISWPPPLTPPYTITCSTSFTDARSPDYNLQHPNIRH